LTARGDLFVLLEEGGGASWWSGLRGWRGEGVVGEWLMGEWVRTLLMLLLLLLLVDDVRRERGRGHRDRARGRRLVVPRARVVRVLGELRMVEELARRDQRMLRVKSLPVHDGLVLLSDGRGRGGEEGGLPSASEDGGVERCWREGGGWVVEAGEEGGDPGSIVVVELVGDIGGRKVVVG
jgi:hypothetical protein